MTDSIDAAKQLLDQYGDKGLAEHCGVVGFDGFVDHIIRVVQHVDGPDQRTYFSDISAFAERIQRAAGKSTALELVTQQVKLGGNGPIMANALATLGLDLTYVGAVGHGDELHPVFEPMRQHCTVVPVSEAAHTEALEFHDGKLMLQQMECLQDFDYQAIVHTLGHDGLLKLFDGADFVALNHWSSLPHMQDIWQQLQDEICPHMQERRRVIFFDLGDPEKRDRKDIRKALTSIGAFGRWYETMLGLNLKESETICQALDCEPSARSDRKEQVAARADAIREAGGIDCVIIHPLAFAAAVNANGTACVDGPFIENPKISTGAGDHLNSGVSLGKMLGGDLKACLQLGVALSGYYVRHAVSPSLSQLRQFLIELKTESL